MQSLRRIITLCLLGASAFPLLTGCGGGGGGDNGNPGGGGTTGTGATGTTGTGTTGPTPSVTSVSIVEPDGLTASLSENTNTISVGGSVTYTLTLTNATSAAVSIHYSSAAPNQPPAGFIVRDPSGSQLPPPVPGTPPFEMLSLAPGQTLASAQTVSGYTVHGTYTATATFNDSGTFATLPPLAVAVQ